MRRFGLLSACLTTLFLTGCSVFEHKPAADTPETAAQTAYLLCDGCHGPHDIRMHYMSPNIIGQREKYLVSALTAYRSGKRTHPFMNGIFHDISDQDIARLAAHYAGFGNERLTDGVEPAAASGSAAHR
ncbi:MAG: cytochrome c [Methylotetracoccus sp.]